jgi:hypothetical protein
MMHGDFSSVLFRWVQLSSSKKALYAFQGVSKVQDIFYPKNILKLYKMGVRKSIF